jgi:hypothetical protein
MWITVWRIKLRTITSSGYVTHSKCELYCNVTFWLKNLHVTNHPGQMGKHFQNIIWITDCIHINWTEPTHIEYQMGVGSIIVSFLVSWRPINHWNRFHCHIPVGNSWCRWYFHRPIEERQSWRVHLRHYAFSSHRPFSCTLQEWDR